MDKRKLLLASTNPGKLRELTDLVGDILDVVSLADFSNVPTVHEDGKSFEANAQKKAIAYARWSQYPTLADDSGLCVDALNGAPGILSARYAPGDDQARIQKLLAKMTGVPIARRTAAFVAALCLAKPDGTSVTMVGKCHGSIAFSPRGQYGFGYDPVFILPDGRSMAELSPDEKKRLSHRADAFRKIKSDLQAVADGFGH